MTKLSELLRNKINITPEMQLKARNIYDDIASLLKDKLAEYEPDIFVQGSFKLQTVIKPIKGDEYDLDIVCHLKIGKGQISHFALKQLVGDALKTKYSVASGQLEQKNRCWRINMYGFHVDVLPAIPETDMTPYSDLIGTKLIDAPIAISDKDLKQWKTSNPRGYAIWFAERAQQEIVRRRLVVNNSKEPLPQQNIGTSILQDAIKVMKYHRDIHFQHNLENKPISIILTTLAARYYDGEQSLEDALYGIVNRIKIHAPSIFDMGQIPNPVLPTENFADKWLEYPERKSAFMEWVNTLHTLLSEYVLNKGDANAESRFLVNGFGLPASAANYASSLKKDLAVGSLGLGTNATIVSMANAAGQAPKYYGLKME